LQCVAVCCSVLQCVAVCCSVLQCVAACCSALQCVAVCCSVLISLIKMTSELTFGKFCNSTSSLAIFLRNHLAHRYLIQMTTGWRRLIGSPKLQIISHNKATKHRSLLRKMTYKDDDFSKIILQTNVWFEWADFWEILQKRILSGDISQKMHAHISTSTHSHIHTNPYSICHAHTHDHSRTHPNPPVHPATTLPHIGKSVYFPKLIRHARTHNHTHPPTNTHPRTPTHTPSHTYPLSTCCANNHDHPRTKPHPPPTHPPTHPPTRA